jgi:GTPase SAR1 family protein
MAELIPIKLVVVGDGYVGKTSILIRFIFMKY